MKSPLAVLLFHSDVFRIVINITLWLHEFASCDRTLVIVVVVIEVGSKNIGLEGRISLSVTSHTKINNPWILLVSEDSVFIDLAFSVIIDLLICLMGESFMASQYLLDFEVGGNGMILVFALYTHFRFIALCKISLGIQRWLVIWIKLKIRLSFSTATSIKSIFERTCLSTVSTFSQGISRHGEYRGEVL